MLADVLVAVRAFPQYRMLMLTLERMGIANPAVYAAAARHAVRLSVLDADRGFVALGQFQSALAILARLVDAHVLDAGHAETLVASLCAVPLNGDGSYAGGIARWLQHSLAPAVSISVDDFDPGLIASLAGVRQGHLRANARVLGAEDVRARPHDSGGTAPDPRARKASSRFDQPGSLALEPAAEALGARTVTLRT